jgi:hypothetical protein
MDPDTLFALSGPVAMLGWGALVLAPRLGDLVAGWIIRGLLSLAHVVLMALHVTAAPGGYTTLAKMQALFTHPGVALAGWVHDLVFDLFVGAWITRRARAEGLSHLLILQLTLLFGPAGLVAFFALRMARTPFAKADA